MNNRSPNSPSARGLAARRSGHVTTAAALVLAITTIAIAGVTPPLPPPARLPVPTLPATREVAPGQGIVWRRAYLPPLPLTVAPRPVPTTSVSLPHAPDVAPAIVRAADALPSRPQLAQPARYPVTPSPALAPRIPNLLVSSRKAQWSSANPIIVPAAAVQTPTVNNLDGTSALALLPPFVRTLPVEIAPAPAPLAVGEGPYVQSPAAPDDQDAPAALPDLPARPVLK
jgi:hypothetical protein